ncbi:MAG: WYL domain-containing protein [Flavobacteriales bacterium]|nr:WYL domain-containing protein [Flavobacteriales bacterium]NCG30898.1 WYL domain-containing protein [Bacteroidota bacterium]MBT3964035.1 WYL domain-containing protein [Flavobacteriales bacterium]MBT4704501.1 WYL domain-containing protein [Flavobacteriales bacterium]MBT4931256.1 WYL domain-containing protein [Flavobacteriales bacterium]
MPANKYALLRYRIIDRCIRNPRNPFPSKEDLRYSCEEALYGSDGEHISMSTIDKDIWAMRNEGELGYYAPIAFNKFEGGYHYEDPEYTISELPLNDIDLEAIQDAANTLFQFRDIPLFRQFDTAIEKILDRMKVSTTDDHSEQEVIQFERTGAYQGAEFLEAVYAAARAQTQLEFEYQKFESEETQSLVLEPYLIKEYRGRWYVIGYDVDKGSIRTYSLDRFVSAKTTEMPFKSKPEFDRMKFFKHAIGITVTDNEPVEVVLKFSSRLTPYIRTQPLHESQVILRKESDGLVVQLNVLNTIELITQILGFGDQVEVLEPIDLRTSVKAALISCVEKYED